MIAKPSLTTRKRVRGATESTATYLLQPLLSRLRARDFTTYCWTQRSRRIRRVSPLLLSPTPFRGYRSTSANPRNTFFRFWNNSHGCCQWRLSCRRANRKDQILPTRIKRGRWLFLSKWEGRRHGDPLWKTGKGSRALRLSPGWLPHRRLRKIH